MTIPRTAKDNPAANQKRRLQGFREVLSRVARQVKKGKIREAGIDFLVWAINFAEHRIFKQARPRLICSCCGYRGHFFIHRGNRLRIAWHSACPHCDSRSRHRGLALLLPDLLKKNPGLKKILHIAPEPVLKPVFAAVPHIRYQTSDLNMSDVDFPGEDLTCLSFSADSFDLILCNHVLEHIGEDEKAISEIARVLAPEGQAIITIPGNWGRQKTIAFQDLSLNGHYRDYGLEVIELFSRYFVEVETYDMHELDLASEGLSYGIKKREWAFICKKRETLNLSLRKSEI